MTRRELMLAVLGALITALAAQIHVPLQHVPMTLQTLVMFAVAAAFGARVGIVCAAFYLLAAWLGAPVLSGCGTIGQLDLFAAKTAGYVVAFAPAALLVGREAVRRRWWTVALAAIAAHALVLAIGGAWLAAHIGIDAAWQNGVVPFLVGAMLKSLLVAPLAAAARRLLRR